MNRTQRGHDAFMSMESTNSVNDLRWAGTRHACRRSRHRGSCISAFHCLEVESSELLFDCGGQ